MKKQLAICISVLLIGGLMMLTSSCSKDDDDLKTGETVKDIDGNVYSTVTIGTQVWMVENLKTTKYRNGDSIPNVLDRFAWAALTTGAYCNYDNDANNSTIYGRLYNWYAVNDNRKIAPVGWHVATDAEWQTLVYYLGGENIAGGKLKETGSIHWEYPNTGATNESGFTALPGGYRDYGYSTYVGFFEGIGYYNAFWTSTEINTVNAWNWDMNGDDASINRDSYAPKFFGASVRCIKD